MGIAAVFQKFNTGVDLGLHTAGGKMPLPPVPFGLGNGELVQIDLFGLAKVQGHFLHAGADRSAKTNPLSISGCGPLIIRIDNGKVNAPSCAARFAETSAGYMTRACALDLRTVLRTGRAGWGRGSIIHLGRGRAFGVYFTLWRCKFLRVLCLDQRQPNGKCAALSHSCAGHFNLSIVRLDKRLRDGQPQPNAAAVSGSIFVDPVEAVENT